MIKGFKQFITHGNAIDLAVGVIIGAAFSAVINSLVESVLNPLIGAIFGKPNFDQVGQFEIGLLGDPAVISPGTAVTALVNFLIVAVALYFFVVFPMNKLANKGEDEGPGEESPEAVLLREILDTLQGQTAQIEQPNSPRHSVSSTE